MILDLKIGTPTAVAPGITVAFTDGIPQPSCLPDHRPNIILGPVIILRDAQAI